MTYDQYWYGDPLMVRVFHKAAKIKRELDDEAAWLNGVYFKSAIEASIGNAFRARGQEPVTYPDLPFLQAEKRRKEEERRRTKEDEIAAAKAYMELMVKHGKFGKK